LHFEIFINALNNGCFMLDIQCCSHGSPIIMLIFHFHNLHAPLFNVAINIEGWIKICTPHLVCSQIWLNHLGLIAIFPTSSYGWS
jgi:hypothetical protein